MRKRRLTPHRCELAEHRIHRARGRGRAILRVERRGEDALATQHRQVLDRLADPRIAVAHREIDDRVFAQPPLEVFRLPPRDRGERRTFLGPHLLVGVGGFLRPGAKDDPVQDRQPGDPRNFDDARIAEELREIAAHRGGLGSIGRAEVDQQHADPALLHLRMIVWLQWRYCALIAIAVDLAGAELGQRLVGEDEARRDLEGGNARLEECAQLLVRQIASLMRIDDGDRHLAEPVVRHPEDRRPRPPRDRRRFRPRPRHRRCSPRRG